MYEFVIKHVHEKDKTLYSGLFILAIDIYLISRIIVRHEQKIKKIENIIKENKLDTSKGE